MRIETLSEKQKQVLDFVVSDKLILICDGSVRSGKTTIMIAGFVIWAMEYFDRTNFAICGKTVRSVERNVIRPLQDLEDLPYAFKYSVSKQLLIVTCGRKENYFYIFGGKDESSYTLIQGLTIAGAFFDEIALMPKSFVEQAFARAIATEHPKYWCNCNPDSPQHWFYKEWIETQRPDSTHIHFMLEDNPILTPQMIARTKTLYKGVFYQRYILGEWVLAEGLVYNFTEENITDDTPESGEYFVSIDYGTLNPFSAGLWCVLGNKAVRIKEYYWDGRAKGTQKTDEDYCDAVQELCKGKYISQIVVDPSAASFIAALKRRGFAVKHAINDVLDGIRLVSRFLNNGNIKIHRSCVDSIREFGLYRWDEKSTTDKVIKENDHAMDEIRYFVNTVLRKRSRIEW